MTEHLKLVDELRAKIDAANDASCRLANGAVCTGGEIETFDDLIEAAEESVTALEGLVREVERCHARLEIDHYFQASDGNELVRVDVPMEARHGLPDAVECRDETIKLIDADRARAVIRGREAEAALSEVRGVLAELAAMVRGECPSLLNEDSGGNVKLAFAIDAALSDHVPAPSKLDREAVARIIDPMAMRSLEEWIEDRASIRARMPAPTGGWHGTVESNARSKWEAFAEPRTTALTKADQIIGLQGEKDHE